MFCAKVGASAGSFGAVSVTVLVGVAVGVGVSVAEAVSCFCVAGASITAVARGAARAGAGGVWGVARAVGIVGAAGTINRVLNTSLAGG